MPEDVNIEQIKKLVKLVEKHNLAELTVEEDGVTITVKGKSAAQPVAQQQPAEQTVYVESTTVEAEAEPVEEIAAEEEAANIVKIESPMVGVFYRTPSPDSPNFVEVGDKVEVGQTIGLIEAMKVFSEIPSEIAGEVVDMPVESGKLVQAGEVIAVIRI